MSEILYTLRVLLPTVKASPCFYTPVFEGGLESGLFIQRVDLRRDAIEAFDRIEDDPEQGIEAPTPRTARVNDAPIFAFGIDSAVAIGPLDEIQPSVWNWVARSGSASLSLQYAELFGSREQLREARTLALNHSSNTASGGDQSRYLAKSMFLLSLWNTIRSGFRSGADLSNVRELHRAVLLQSEIGNQDVMPDELWKRLEPLVDFHRGELRDRVLSELPASVVSTARKASEQDHQFILPAEPLRQETLRTVYAVKRQEERIALILDKFIRRPALGKWLIDNYQPSAKFEQRALHRLHHSYLDIPSENERILFVASLVRRFFTLSFPLARGQLLYYLAKHLGKYDEVADAIRSKLEASHAFVVQMLAADIADALSATIKRPN